MEIYLLCCSEFLLSVNMTWHNSFPYNMGELILWLRLSVHLLCLNTAITLSHLLRFLGLCNNFAYVVMLSAAHDILKKQELGNSTATVRIVLLFAVIVVKAWILI